MYVKLLRLLGFVTILTTFWSGVRVANISVFELLAVLYVAAAFLHRPSEPGPVTGFEPFKLAIAGICVMALSGILSSPASFDMSEHLVKASKLVAAFMLTLGVAYMSSTRRVFTLTQMLRVLTFSAAFCSLIAVAQGQFGRFMSFVPQAAYGGGGGRMTGLTEHPIEMGLVSGYGVAVALGLAMQNRKWLMASVLIGVNAYSMRYSASLTAVIALVLSVGVVCVYTRNFKALVGGGVVACIVTLLVIASGSKSALLLDRVKMLMGSGGSYTTVQTREAQYGQVLESISPATILMGNGYSESDLPYKMEIHNGILASVYHFGVLGLLAQMLVIGFFVGRMAGPSSREEKSALLGCIVIFSLAYLSGPPQARPSLWAPPLFLAALLLPRRRAEASSPDGLFGRLSEPVQPGP